jgi:5-methylcytosine-specific restriction endonuclease McrA
MRPVPERTAAIAARQRTYNTGKPCKNGHLSDRWTRSGNCIICDREKAIRFLRNGGTPEHPNRIAARADGDRHYGGQPCPKGHDKRFVANGHCVECSVKRSRKWQAARPGYEAAYKRDYRKRFPDKHKEINKRYCQHNPDKRRENDRRWRAANIEYWRQYMAVYSSNRRARKAKNGGFYTIDDVERLREQQSNCCAACGSNEKRLEVDHIVAVVRGGSNDPSNLQLLCGPCNKSKGAKDMGEWAAGLGDLSLRGQ